ncbi:hypothetical protein IFT36_04535 [Frigoribacterium sp. CFBP 13605]|uniref:hypothetical protein n=1 Tax=Frigoribacterium sp. CFBP 13605 TaxID=2774034 RepID=UPI001902C357|nr:hypothetical protein [Frigoribacterium sp. CFBP 13605]MBD8139812.1 hypothetical protein [Frigoribacterium sp. CFBP 13605]
MLAAIGMAIAEGVLSEAGGALWHRLTAPEAVRRGRPVPTRFQKDVATQLAAWCRSERTGADDLVAGVQLAVDLLARLSVPTARQLVDASGSTDVIVEGWLERHPLDGATTAQAAVSKRFLVESLDAALLDPEYSQALILDIVTDVARRVSRMQVAGFTATHVALARVRSRHALDLIRSRRPPGAGEVPWEFDDDDFDFDFGWGAEVLAKIEKLEEAAGRHLVQRRLPRPQAGARHASTLMSINDRRFRDALDSLVRAVAGPASGTGPSDVRGAAGWLRAQAATPRYQDCLPIAGAWGTGKSDFVASIALGALGRGTPSVVLHRGRGGLRETLLAQASDVFGFDFATVDGLESSLDAFGAALLVIVEDSDEWAAVDPTFAQELRDSIEAASGRRRLRWTLTADSLSLDLLLDARDRNFWQRHGVVDDALRGSSRHAASGWFELDPLVVEKRVGFRMLESTRVVGIDAIAHAADVPGSPGTYALLCRPVVASILTMLADADADADADAQVESTAGGLTEDGFLDEFWRLVVLTGGESAGERDRLAELIDRLAARLSKRGGESVAWEKVRRDVFGRAASTTELNVAERSIRALSSSGVVARVDGAVESRAEIAWGRRIAGTVVGLSAMDPDGLVEVLRPWVHPETSTQRALGRYVSRSLFRDAERLAVDPALLSRVWRRLLVPDADNGALWLSAPVLDAGLQHRLAGQATRFLDAATSAPGDVYALFFWMLHARPDVWTRDDTLRVLERRYDDVEASATGVYALQVLASALSASPLQARADRLDVLTRLVGTDQAKIGGPAAQLFVECAVAHASPSAVMTSVVAHLHTRDSGVLAELRRSEDAGFALGLVYACIGAVLDEVPVGDADEFAKAADFLLTRDWNEKRARGRPHARPSDKSAHIAYAIVAQSRTSIGHHHKRNREVVHDYVARLLTSDAPVSDLMSAFFIVRHSVPTAGRSDLMVDQRWRDVLESIAADIKRFPSKIRSDYVIPLLEANGVPLG